MGETSFTERESAGELDLIETQGPALRDSNQFLVRYAPAVRRYLEALLKNTQDAEDVAQSFFLRIVERGFGAADPERGRFRHYLKVAVRNAALTFLRSKKRQPRVCSCGVDALTFLREDSDGGQSGSASGNGVCSIALWEGLSLHQQLANGGLHHDVLRASVDHPDDDSATLAARVRFDNRSIVESRGIPQAELSRSSSTVPAQLLVREVARTLKSPTPDDIDEELTEIGLRDHVRRYLDAD